LGDLRIPDSLVTQLAKVLRQGSRLHDSDVAHDELYDFETVDMSEYSIGSTASGAPLPRERFSYWCFDLLFLICSDTSKNQESARRRAAALGLPSLLNRCQTTMVKYVADEALRGNLPFPRAREDELLYILRKILELRLWPGTLWASVSDAPTTHCLKQPPIDSALSPSGLIADAVKRSVVAHLFQFYPILCDIASIPRKTPSAWVMAEVASPLLPSSHMCVDHVDITSRGKTEKLASNEKVLELDARALARECLKLIGKEIGMGIGASS